MKVFLSLLIGLFLRQLSQAQHPTVNFFLVNLNTNLPLTENGITLRILSDHAAMGEDHPFINGSCSIKYPASTVLKYTILSDKYYLPDKNNRPQIVQEHHVIPGNNNSVTVELRPLDERNLIIRGRIKSSKTKELVGTKVLLDMERLPTAPAPKVVDSFGFFQFVFEDGDALIGTRYTITIQNPLFELLERQLTVENKRVNVIENLVLTPKTHPPKYGYIQFSGPKGSIDNLVVLSKHFQADEVKKGTGLFKVIALDDSPPAMASFQVKCPDCSGDSFRIASSNFLDKTYKTDVSYDPPALSIFVGGSLQYISGGDLQKRTAPGVSVGVSKIFRLGGSWIGVSASATIVAPVFTLTNKYTTLPGNEGQVLSDFKLLSLPQLDLYYFFRNPLYKKPSFYAGLTGTFYTQSFKGIESDKTIEEEQEDHHGFAPGVKGGIHYNISKLFTLQGEVMLDYYSLTSTQYNFNYFGRADEQKSTSNYLNVHINACLLVNL